jgi:hypothetical protein
MSTGPDLRGWAGDGDGLPSLEQLTHSYDKLKPVAEQSIPESSLGLVGDDLAALRQEVSWASDADVLRRTAQLLRGRNER